MLRHLHTRYPPHQSPCPLFDFCGGVNVSTAQPAAPRRLVTNAAQHKGPANATYDTQRNGARGVKALRGHD